MGPTRSTYKHLASLDVVDFLDHKLVGRSRARARVGFQDSANCCLQLDVAGPRLPLWQQQLARGLDITRHIGR